MWIVWIAVGLLVGWNLPQPEFAKNAQVKFVAWIRTWIK
jgi:hypothetical protein